MFKEPEYAQTAYPIQQEESGTNKQAMRDTPTFLAIPKFGPNVVTCYATTPEPVLIRLAEICIKLGIITESDVTNNPSVYRVAKNVLQRHFDALLGKMKVLRFNFEFSTKNSGSEFVFWYDTSYDDEEDSGKNAINIPEEFFLEFAIREDKPNFITIGKAIDELEILYPGLGQTAYAVLCRSGNQSLRMMSTYFMFNESREFCLGEEYEEMIEVQREEGNELVTKEEWLQNIPAWMANPIALLTPYQVQQIGLDINCPLWVKEITEAMIAVFHSYTKNHCLGTVELYDKETQADIVIIRHNEQDQIVRAVDDMSATANLNSDYYTTSLHLEVLDLRDFRQCKSWFKKMEKACAFLKSIDRLLYSLTYEPIQKEQST